MAYSRNEYLQSLNRMRSNYQSQGNPLINTEDDNGNVGNELSSFAYVNTEPQSSAPEQASQASKVERNGWKRTVDTIHSGISNVTEGVTNFIDDIWDFAVVSTSWLTGLLSGVGHAIFDSDHDFSEGWEKGTQWTQPLTTFEWENYLNQWWNQMDLGHAVFSGDLFTGEWGQRWADMGDAEKNKENLAQVHENSWANEWGDFGQGLQKVEQGVGYVLPSLVLAYFTGGTSLGAQTLIQSGVAGATALGSGFEQATKEGADYGEALGYGAVKGTISAGLSAVTTWVGGNAVLSKGGTAVSNLSKKAGEQVLKLTHSKTAEVVAGKAIEITAQAGISGARAYAMTMAEPAFKTIYNDKTLAESYSGENLSQTLELAKQSALYATATSAVVGTIREGTNVARYGKDGYFAKYYAEKATMYAKQESNKLKANSEAFQKAKEKLDKLYENTKITKAEYDERLQVLKNDLANKTMQIKQNIESKVLSSVRQAQEYYDNIIAKGSTEKTPTISHVKVKNMNEVVSAISQMSETDIERFKVGELDRGDLSFLKYEKDYGINDKTIKTLYALKQSGMPLGSNKADWYVSPDGTVGNDINQNLTFEYFSKNGVASAEATKNIGLLTYKNNGRTVEVEINVGKTNDFVVKKPDDVSNSIIILGSNDKNALLPTNIKVNSTVLNIPNVEFDGLNTKFPLTISKDISSKILNKSNSREIMNFFENGLQGKGKENFVMKATNGEKKMVVEPFNDGDTQKYGVITINGKTNEITDIAVKPVAPTSNIKFSIAPKVDEKSLQSTKFVDENKNPITVSEQNGKIVISKDGNATLNVSKWARQSELNVTSIIKKFDIETSLTKFINSKVNDKNISGLINYLMKKSGLNENKVVARLGYEAIVSNDGTVIGGNLRGKLISLTNGGLKDERMGLNDKYNANGKIDKQETRQGYAQRMSKNSIGSQKETRTFRGGKTPEKIVTVVNKKDYNKDLKNIENKIKNIYSVSSEVVFGFTDDKNVLGFFDPNSNSIFIALDGNNDFKYETSARHEVIHYNVFNKTNFGLKTFSITKDLIGRLEFKKSVGLAGWEENILKRFTQIQKLYPHFSYDDTIEELCCELFSGELTDGVKGGLILDKNLAYNIEAVWKDYEKQQKLEMSRETNNKGYYLTKDIAKAFKKSVVRNIDGDLLVLYHGSKDTDFTYFDIDKSDYFHSAFGYGMYLTNRMDRAQDYAGYDGKIFSVYVNITNPIMPRGNNFTVEKIKALGDALSKKYNIDLLKEIGNAESRSSAVERNNKYAEFYSFANQIGKKFNNYDEFHSSSVDDLDIFKTIEVSIGFKNKNITPKQLTELIVETTGFDGVIAWRGEYAGDGAQIVSFIPNQIKSVLNYSPTMSSRDIKFSTTNKQASIGLAITYDESIDSASYNQKIAKYKPMVEKKAGAVAKLLGLNVTVGEAIGGWTFTDNANKIVIGGEPSFPIDVKNYKSLDDVKLFASLLADTAYEVQNSVGVIEYDESGNDIEDTFYLTKVDDGLNEIIKNAKLEGFTLKKVDKKLVIVGAGDDIIDTLLTELENGGYLDVEKHEASKCNANWLGLKERANLYETWLKNHVGEENGRLSGYVTKASEINKYITSRLDKNGYRTVGTENSASNILKFLSQKKVDNRPNKREIIKSNANLKHEKVYNLKTANQIVDNALVNMLNKWGNAIKISIPTGKNKLKDFTFEELNLYKDKDKAIENIVNQIESAIVTFDNGNNGTVKAPLKDFNMHDDLTKAIKGLVAHKGELSEKSKWVKHYYDTLRRYAGYVHERALLTSEYVTALKAQKTLDKIFEDTRTMKIGGDTVVNEITLYKQLTNNLLLSKSAKNVAPSTFTKLVNNFNNYTAENYADYFDVALRDLVDELALSFEDGKFPNREPTLNEMQLFNAIRGRIIARCRTLVSEKHQLKIKNNELGTKLASVALPAIEPKTYGKVKNVLDSAISFPVKIRSVLGSNHPFVKLFTENYLKVSANAISKTNEFRTYNFETLAKEAGYPKRGALLKDLKKKIIEIKDRSGRVYKKTVDDVIGAYWTYKTAQEQLLATGLTAYNDKNKTDVDFKIDDELYQDMFNKLPANARKWADLVYDKYFNGMDYEYKMSIIKEFFGDLNFLSARKGTYAPTSRVGQVNMGVGATSQFDAGYLSTMLKGFLKERVKNKNHFRWMSASDTLEHNMQQVATWGEKSQWVDDVRSALNTTIPGTGNHTLEYYLDKHVPEWKQVWSPYMSKIILGKPILEKKHGLLEFLGNVGQVSTLGGNIGSILRQTLSDFSWTFDERVTWKTWLATIPQAVSNFFRMGSIKKELMENNGYFIERFNEGEVIKAIMNGKLPFKIGQIVLKPMEWLDSVVVSTHGYALAKRIVNDGIKKGYYDFAKGSPEYKREVAHVLQGMTLISQSNADPMFLSRLRSGDAGWINREVFGRFASDNQNKYQALEQITREKINSEKRRKAYEKASKDDKYSEEEKEAFRQASEQETKDFKKNYGKKVAGFAVAIILNGLGAYAITHFIRKIKGKEEWDEFGKPEEVIRDIFLESTVNWVPYISTIANAIENNSDVSAFTIDKLNNLVDMVKLVEKAFEKGDEASIKRAIWSLVTNGLELTGIPANNIYQLFMGIWYQFDKDGSLSAQSWVKGYNSSYMKSQYTSAITSGNTARAKAQLGAWSSMYSTNITDEATLDELVRLSIAGYNATPSANATSYTNDKGDKVSFTSAQARAFKTEYAKSNKVVSELLKIEDYKKQDDNAKASMISKIYNAYRDSAQAKALGVAPNSKLAKLLYYTNGDVDLAKYIMSMQNLSVIKDDEKQTRKEKVITEINKIKGFNKNEKLLLAYLSGYSVSEKSQNRMLNFLMSKGMNRTDAKTYLGLD